MRIIDKGQVLDLIYNHNLIPDDKCIIVNQENGDTEEIRAEDISDKMGKQKNAVFETDDDGAARIITLDVHYGYVQNDLDTGYIIRILLYRLEQKRMQYNLFSNGVGAPTHKKLHS